MTDLQPSAITPLGICICGEGRKNAARAVSYSHYVYEILDHAGVWYCKIQGLDLEDALPNLRILVTVGEVALSDSGRQALQEWVEGGGAWISIAGLSGLEEWLGLRPVHSGYQGFGAGKFCPLGEGYLRSEKPNHPVLEHLSIPLHFFNGLSVEVDATGQIPAGGNGTQVLATTLDCHGRPTDNVALVEQEVSQGYSLFIAPDLVGSVVRIQQGIAVTRDGMPSPDGTAPTSDGVFKSDDGCVLDWYFDRESIEGAPGLSGFLQPIADQWREILLRSIFYLADKLDVVLPVLWLYPRNVPAIAHMSHDTDGNDPEHARVLLGLLEQAEIKSTWCTIVPGYEAEIINAVREARHELAMHYDAMSDGLPWSEAQFASQMQFLTSLFGEKPTTNKNHYLRWEGDTEFFDWCVRYGIQLEQSKGTSKTGEVGFNFGTCHPYLPVAPDGSVLDVLELPTPTQDMEVFAPSCILTPLLKAARKHYGVLHVLFHQGHTHKPPVAAALLQTVAEAKAAGMEWWTAKQLNNWERARRGIQWQQTLDANGQVLGNITTGQPLHEATVMFSGSRILEVTVDGQNAPTQTVRRWGFDFQYVIVDLTGETNIVTNHIAHDKNVELHELSIANR
jgi:hypothetical protein